MKKKKTYPHPLLDLDLHKNPSVSYETVPLKKNEEEDEISFKMKP
jgi:hypothetical protein